VTGKFWEFVLPTTYAAAGVNRDAEARIGARSAQVRGVNNLARRAQFHDEGIGRHGHGRHEAGEGSRLAGVFLLEGSGGDWKIGRESFSGQINIVGGVDGHGVNDIGSIAAQIRRVSQGARGRLKRASRQRETQETARHK
jgi:hypothetical protein